MKKYFFTFLLCTHAHKNRRYNSSKNRSVIAITRAYLIGQTSFHNVTHLALPVGHLLLSCLYADEPQLLQSPKCVLRGLLNAVTNS